MICKKFEYKYGSAESAREHNAENWGLIYCPCYPDQCRFCHLNREKKDVIRVACSNTSDLEIEIAFNGECFPVEDAIFGENEIKFILGKDPRDYIIVSRYSADMIDWRLMWISKRGGATNSPIDKLNPIY